MILLIMLGLFGAALLYGDGVITPAISVLSAVEGLEVATTAFSPYVVPITCLILVGAVRGPEARHRRHRRGLRAGHAVSGSSPSRPSGCPGSCATRRSCCAANPLYGVRFFAAHGRHGFLVLGSVVLCVTGGEALYADMGHFGTRAIRTAWYACVFPALLLNYFGQGALLLERPERRQQPVLRAGPGRAGSSRWWCSRRSRPWSRRRR